MVFYSQKTNNTDKMNVNLTGTKTELPSLGKIPYLLGN